MAGVSTDIGEWNHIVFTVDSDGGSSVTKSYKNGVEQASNDTGDLVDFNIGSMSISTQTSVTHDISDVRIYGRPITASEVKRMYDQRRQ